MYSDCTYSSQFAEVIHKIHLASGSEDKWNPLLSDIMNLFESTSATIARHDFSTGHGERIYQAPINQKRTLDYNNKYCIRNPWFMSSSDYATNRVMTGEQLIDIKVLKKSDFYNNYLKPYGVIHRLCGVIKFEDNHVHFIALHRSARLPAYSNDDISLLEEILYHLKVALKNHWQLLNAKGISRMFESFINHFDHAAFLIDSNGTIVYQHKDTDTFMQAIRGITIAENKIKTTTDSKMKLLQTALNEIEQLDDDQFETNKIVPITETRLQQPVILNLRPFGSIYSLKSMQYKKVILLTVKTTNEDSIPLHHCSFSNLYDLTPAQSRVCPYIFSGHSLSFVAKTLHLSENTIRSHLKQIFLKTNTHSQIEVIQLHARICDEAL